jgi:hypothetical protein
MGFIRAAGQRMGFYYLDDSKLHNKHTFTR